MSRSFIVTVDRKPGCICSCRSCVKIESAKPADSPRIKHTLPHFSYPELYKNTALEYYKPGTPFTLIRGHTATGWVQAEFSCRAYYSYYYMQNNIGPVQIAGRLRLSFARNAGENMPAVTAGAWGNTCALVDSYQRPFFWAEMRMFDRAVDYASNGHNIINIGSGTVGNVRFAETFSRDFAISIAGYPNPDFGNQSSVYKDYEHFYFHRLASSTADSISLTGSNPAFEVTSALDTADIAAFFESFSRGYGFSLYDQTQYAQMFVDPRSISFAGTTSGGEEKLTYTYERSPAP